jgi:DNA polymerase I-like protein with 3'-5' exonuclease and polymerase domains
MIGQIKYIAKISDEVVPLRKKLYPITEGTWDEFVDWASKQTRVQFDIETSVTDAWNDKELISLQFGSCTMKKDRQQWFLQWSELDMWQRDFIRIILQDKAILKLCHNAKFEYIVMKFNGIVIENFYDTMLAEKVLRGGLENEDYALADISWKYLRIMMDKTEQVLFGDNIITHSKVNYGITDVAYLDVIMRIQYEGLAERNLLNVAGLEMAALNAFSDATFNGMKLSVEKWRENIRLAEPVIDAAFKKIDAWLLQEPFKAYAIQKGHWSDKDRTDINYNSVPQKYQMLNQIFPELTAGSKPIVKKYMKDNMKALGENLELLNILVAYVDKEYQPMYDYLLEHKRDFLVSAGFLIPAGQSTINWNSVDQVLPLMKLVEPRLKSLSEEDINKTKHPALRDLQAYKEALKLTSTYGEEFIRKHVNSDGMVRSNYNQVISTGRVSSSKPNMQNIIVTEQVGTRYRNAFEWSDQDFVFVDSDYKSQELVVIAYLSKDPVWMDAIANDYDLHSVCADLVFKWKWKQAEEAGCNYYHMVVGPNGKLRPAKQRCKCKGHKHLRDQVKPISFGLAYGMSEFKLAGTLQITVPQAAALIDEYFKTFPAIGKVLNFLGNFGLDNGYIMTLAPFFRRRYFPYWEENRPYITPHKLGAQRNKTLGEIERASKNMPIQGASADITKVAMVLIRDFIYENRLQDKIKIVAQVHDQITTVCHKDLAEWWKIEMDRLMCEAALIVIPTGILKAETTISNCWTK